MKLLLGPRKCRKKYVVCRLSDNVRVWAREQKCLKALSEDREWRRSCDMSRQVVPYRGFKKLETLLYHTVFIYLQTIISFCPNARVWQTDGQTDWTARARL